MTLRAIRSSRGFTHEYEVLLLLSSPWLRQQLLLLDVSNTLSHRCGVVYLQCTSVSVLLFATPGAGAACSLRGPTLRNMFLVLF